MKYQVSWLKSFGRRVAPKGVIFTVCSFVLSLMSDLSAALILGKMGPLRDIKSPQKWGCQVLTTRFSFPDIANG